jgi:hypothetical protein
MFLERLSAVFLYFLFEKYKDIIILLFNGTSTITNNNSTTYTIGGSGSGIFETS